MYETVAVVYIVPPSLTRRKGVGCQPSRPSTSPLEAATTPSDGCMFTRVTLAGSKPYCLASLARISTCELPCVCASFLPSRSLGLASLVFGESTQALRAER